MPLERLRSKTTTEILWVYLLNLLREQERYAYELRDQLHAKFGFRPARITSYVVLYRLEKAGYVAAERKGNKKYYRITEEGERLYREGIEHFQELVAKLR